MKSIDCANYIVNCTPTMDLKYITLEEIQSKIKLNVRHFHVFGKEAWTYIPDEKRKSL
jgi:hypothetical protein